MPGLQVQVRRGKGLPWALGWANPRAVSCVWVFQVDGEWHDVPVVENGLVVNVARVNTPPFLRFCGGEGQHSDAPP